MKKIEKAIVIIVIILEILLISLQYIPSNFLYKIIPKSENIKIDGKKINYEIIYHGYTDEETQIISTYKDFKNFINNIYSNILKETNLNKYTDEYFNTKSIAIINISTGSSDNNIDNITLAVKNNQLTCYYDIKYPKSRISSNNMMSGLLLLSEIDKSIQNIEMKPNYK